jgi:hypothetical protein
MTVNTFLLWKKNFISKAQKTVNSESIWNQNAKENI